MLTRKKLSPHNSYLAILGCVCLAHTLLHGAEQPQLPTFDHDMLMASSDSIMSAYEQANKSCHEQEQVQPELYNILKEQLHNNQKFMSKYAKEVSFYLARHDYAMAAGRIEYMKLLLEKTEAIKNLLLLKSPHKQRQETQESSLCERILKFHGIAPQRLSPSHSTPLKRGAETIGFARSFPQGIVIELKGTSQSYSMACGASAYAYARILKDTKAYPELLNALRDEKLLKQYEQELADTCIKKLTEIWGADHVQALWKSTLENEGVPLELLYEAAATKKLFTCVHDARQYSMFPSDEQAAYIAKQGKQNWLKYTFYPHIERFCPGCVAQPCTLPTTILLLTGHNVVQGGHWIAAHLENMENHKIGIIFADSCPYARDEHGNIIEAVDKIADYQTIFLNWFTSIAHSLTQ